MTKTMRAAVAYMPFVAAHCTGCAPDGLWRSGATPIPAPPGMKLVWHDEFDGKAR